MQASAARGESMATRDDIDDLDRAIIGVLTEDGRLSAAEVASRVGGLSERTARNRISALLQHRHIVIGAIPDPEGGSAVQADLLIEVERGRIDAVAAELVEYEEVGYLAALSGSHSLSAAVFFDTNAELLDFAENVVGAIPGVRRVAIDIILRKYKVFGTRTTALGAPARAAGTRRPRKPK